MKRRIRLISFTLLSRLRWGRVVCLLLLIALSWPTGALSTHQTKNEVATELSSPRLQVLQQQLRKGTRGAIDEFWAEVKRRGTPLVEPIPGDQQNVWVTFLWRGAEDTRSVVIFGQLDPHASIKDRQMARLPESDIWFRSYRVQHDRRFSYQLVLNDDLSPLGPNTNWQKRLANARPDPLNHNRYPDTPGMEERNVASLVELPAATPQPWVARRPSVPKGKVESQTIKSAILNNERQLWVYLPAEYKTDAAPYALLLIFDGWAYANLIGAPTILNNLIGSGEVPPVVAVMIDQLNPSVRNRELACNEKFVSFLASELIPWVRARYHVTTNPAKTIVAGSSFGGLAATCAAIWHPEVFGNVLSQSGAFWWKPESDSQYEWMAQQFAARSKLALQFYLDVGLSEIATEDEKAHDQIGSNRRFRDALRAKGYEVHYAEFKGGHDYLDWRGTFSDGLLSLIGKRSRK